MRNTFRLLIFGLLAVSLLDMSSCRSSRNAKTNPRTKPTPPPAAAATNTTPQPSAKSVMNHADSALMRVSQLASEDREAPPMAEPPQNNDQQRTPWGTPPTPQPNLTDYGVYEAALADYNASRYDEAISLFGQVVSNGRPAELVPNAYYWMGESFYAMNRYAEAMPYFEYVTRVGPQYKREMSLYKLSRANLHLENQQAANMYYERLRNEYPKSSHIALLRRLGAR